MKWATQILTWASTLIIARILTPADFGLMGMAQLYLGFVQMVSEFGLGASIIHDHALRREQIAQLGGVSILMGLGIWGLSWIAAVPVSWVFGEPGVRPIIGILGVTFVTMGFRVVPRSLMVRDFQFKRVAAVDVCEAIVTTIVTLTLAFLGYRYWSLVWGAIAGSLAGTLLALFWRAHVLRWPSDLRTISHTVKFGGHIVVSRISWYLYSNADFAVVGRSLGKAVLGAYTFGWSLASIPVNRISAMVGQVTPSVFSKVKHDKAALRRYLLRLSEGLAFLTFPLAVGIALVAEDFVLAALGEKWRGAIVPLRLLALSAAVRSISTLFPQLLNYTGRSREQMRFALLALAVLPPAFWIGAHWFGTLGVGVAWLVGYTLVILPGLFVALDITGMALGEYLGALWPATLGSIVMAAAILLERAFLPQPQIRLVRLGFEAALGAAVYAGFMLSTYRPRIMKTVNLVREMRGRA